eukprot:jgi/Chlat1/8517/Chrsp80S07899
MHCQRRRGPAEAARAAAGPPRTACAIACLTLFLLLSPALTAAARSTAHIPGFVPLHAPELDALETCSETSRVCADGNCTYSGCTQPTSIAIITGSAVSTVKLTGYCTHTSGEQGDATVSKVGESLLIVHALWLTVALVVVLMGCA